MALELPATPEAVVLVAVAVEEADDVQAALATRGEAPNTQLPVSIILLVTSCKGIRAITIKPYP